MVARLGFAQRPMMRKAVLTLGGMAAFAGLPGCTSGELIQTKPSASARDAGTLPIQTAQPRIDLLPNSLLSKTPAARTLGGLPFAASYSRTMPDQVTPAQFGHEKVGYPMSDYDHLSFLPLGGLGSPLCEIDYSTCYIKEGHMIQDAPIRQMNVKIELADGKTVEADLSKTNGFYYALYPISERSFDLPINLSVVQYSPVNPGDYESSSQPVEIVDVVAKNTTNKVATVTFSLSQENILGWYPKASKEDPKNPHGLLVWDKQSNGNFTEAINSNNVKGLLFQKKGKLKDQVRVGSGLAGQIAIASSSQKGVNITVDEKTNTITISFTLQPGEQKNHPIAVAYDLPFYNFQYKATDPNSPGVRMPKEYTRYYDATGQNAEKIAADALKAHPKWRKAIAAFQDKITTDRELPDFFKQALLNELYVLAETGIWEASQGRFAYLESIDYKMYNTSDVNSYTWALFLLFPELEKRDLLELANLVPLSDPTTRWFGTDRWTKVPPEWQHLYWAPVKDAGAVCHDLGGLLGEGVFPFMNRCNEFNWSNADMWIDLAPKFVLRAWRYINVETPKPAFINKLYPSVKMALDTLEKRWGDKETHVPISKGIPDWTYDTISGHGYTPNVVTQWTAALEAAAKMAKTTGDEQTARKYSAWREAATKVLEELWNEEGGYYNAFASADGSKVNNSIHSDMLFGDFYARMTGLSPVVPNDKATKALETIFRVNGQGWSKVGDRGPIGLVNLRGPNGEQNKTEQGDEGWTGTMLLNAAYQIRVGRETGNQKLVDNGWEIVRGFHSVVYGNGSDSQYLFGRTPEGYTNPDDVRYNDPKQKYGNETTRAPKYMRALAIWAVYAALKGQEMPFDFYNSAAPETKDTFPLPYAGKKEDSKKQGGR